MTAPIFSKGRLSHEELQIKSRLGRKEPEEYKGSAAGSAI